MKPIRPYPFLYRDVDRQNAIRWRLRAPGRPTVTIKGQYGSPEFAANYRAAMEGEARPNVPVGIPCERGSLRALARDHLASADFIALAPETQRKRRDMIERLVDRHGDKPVARLEHKHVRAIMDEYATKPGVAINMLSAIKVLVARAVADGTLKHDPTIGIKRPKLSKEGWHSWEDDEIAKYEAHHPVGSQARLALALALYTGQREADVIRMGKQHVRDGGINVVQQKTGAQVWISLHPELKAIMDATPLGHLVFLVSNRNEAYASAQSFGNKFREWTKEAGLTGCQFHGLRKACARRLAEAGCTAVEIMSITGHSSLKEVERYVRAANQMRISQMAIEKVSGTSLTHASRPWVKKAEKAL